VGTRCRAGTISAHGSDGVEIEHDEVEVHAEEIRGRGSGTVISK
jgi:hypothetical protein